MSRRRDVPDDDDLRVVRRDSLLVLRLHDREVEVLAEIRGKLPRERNLVRVRTEAGYGRFTDDKG